MNKIISILALSAFVGISGLSAGVDSSESKAVQTLSKTDSEFLFGANAKNLNVEVLSQKELDETRAEFWPLFLYGLSIGYMGVANAPGPNGPTYSHPAQVFFGNR